MAKTQKAPAPSPTAKPRADMNGWVLCPGDGVLIISPGEEYHGLFAKVDTFPTKLELSSYVQIDGRPSTVGRVLVPNAHLRWMGPGLEQVDQLRPTRPGQRVRVVLDNESLATPEMRALDGQLGEVTELGPVSGNNVSMITVKFDDTALLPAAIYNYDLLIVPTPVVQYVPEAEATLTKQAALASVLASVLAATQAPATDVQRAARRQEPVAPFEVAGQAAHEAAQASAPESHRVGWAHKDGSQLNHHYDAAGATACGYKRKAGELHFAGEPDKLPRWQRCEECDEQLTPTAPAPITEPTPVASPAAKQKLTLDHFTGMVDTAAAGLRVVPLASIVVTTNTRKVFDETALAELAESVKAHGILQPIVLRPHATEAGQYELVAGGRRYRAAQLAGLTEVPATVRNLTDREFLEVQLLENLQRVDVRPADEATAFAKLLGSNFSAEEIGLKVGKPVKFVLQRAKLVTLIPFWMELLEADRLPLVAAHELARLPAHSQVVVRKEIDGTWEFKQGKVLDPHTVRSTINSKVLRKLDQVAWPLDDATLYPEAGPCTTCPKRSGACRGLFDDLQQEGKSDNCLDAACFSEKTKLFVQRRRIELAGSDTPLLSGASWDSKGAVIGFGYYSSAQENEKGAVLALVVDGSEAGKTRWVKIKTAASTAKDSKAEREASIRKNRIARQANELKADLLRELFSNQLSGQGGAGIHALLNHFIKHSLEYGRSRTPNAMMEYLQVQYGWEAPTEADLNTQTNPTQTWIDGDLNTPHRAYLVRQLAKMPLVVDKIRLYFDLKFRSGLEQSEVLQVQDTLIKRLPTNLQDEFDVTAKATQLVEERFYQKKGKKQEVAA